MLTNEPTLLELVNQVPREPGCYLWKDAAGKVLYVGKAKNLRARMKQYVLGEDTRPMISQMMVEVKGFDYIVVGSEHEALVLEINLIQQYKPYFNVDLKDDKSYPFIALTKSQLYPALKYTREKHKPGTKYFGPYTDSRAARQAIDIVRKICPLCLASCPEWKKVCRMEKDQDRDGQLIQLQCMQSGRPCFDYHVGKGPGVCTGAISPEEYQENVKQVERFLSGHRQTFTQALKDEMATAAQNLEFEKAGRIKRRLEVISSLDQKQQVMFSQQQDMDVFGFWREETIAGACVFIVREGRVIRSCDFILNKGQDESEQELVGAFVKRYYRETSDIPQQVLVPLELDDADAVGEWLSKRRGKKCQIHVPRRGEKARLRTMADANARHALMRYELKTGYEDQRINEALLQLESALALQAAPRRIECFDISTIHGSYTVASMVVFTTGVADKSQYRRFKIKTPLDEANDVVSMAEVISRRYSKERMADERFGSKPDLLILDGGKPQLNAVTKQLGEMGVDIPVVGLAKSDEELFVTWDENPVVLPSGSASLYLVKRIRDEAHRFAITFHRELRGKAMTISILDEVEGVGPKRKKALKKHFGSMKKLRQASVEELASVDGISQKVAEDIYKTLQDWEQERKAARQEAGILEEEIDE